MTAMEAVEKALPLARAIQTYWDVELPKRHPRYPYMESPDADDGPPPPETQELRELLESLSDETLYKVGLVMFLGRRSIRPENLAAGHQELVEEYERDFLSEWILSDYHLAEYLEDALEMLTARGVDLDRLDLTPVGV